MAKGLKFQFDSIPDEQYLIVVWYKNSSPLAEAGRQVYAGPHLNVLRTLAPNLSRTTYTFKFFQSSDGTTLEVLKRTWDIDARIDADSIEQFKYVVGRGDSETDVWADPVADSNVIVDTRLAEATKDELFVHRGTRPLMPGEFELRTGGGIVLQVDDTFGDEEYIYIVWYHKITLSEGDNTGGSSDYNGVVPFSSSITFNPAIHLNKVMPLVGGSGTVVVTFNDFSSIPGGKVLFQTNASTARYLKFQFASGNTVAFFGKDRNKVLIGQGQRFELMFFADNGVVFAYAMSTPEEAGYDKVGETIMSNFKNKPNYWLCGDPDTEYLVADFERLHDELPTEMTVPYSQWGAFADTVVSEGEPTVRDYINRGKFAISPDGTKFKFPDLRGEMFKVLDDFEDTLTNRLAPGAGGKQPQQLFKHRHPMNITDGDAGGNTDYLDTGDINKTKLKKNNPCDYGGKGEQWVDNLAKYGLVGI